ncbi:metalloregulator ArsR/SmtB family transcription factor [Actinoplanes sp. L3-i22]|uniref:ArsR/SmtB family transcription factor n=1 Tax=Actinoplanes sp. L3-i22 TaxID=2836373 RepID=UPI002106C12E|nr:metalloregulator ArsR/SmtB family transcription factor [Actinoplanes sp. L3-i22]
MSAAVPRVTASVIGIPPDGVRFTEDAGLTAAPLEASRATAFATMFKALGDPVRLRLLSMIASAPGGEICVCDLSSAFHLTGPTISHHLRILREAGLVDSDRRGTWVYYRAVPATLILLAGLLHGGPSLDGS